MILLVFSVVLVALFAIARWRRPAQLKNGTLLVAAAGSAVLGTLQLVAGDDPTRAALLVVVGAAVLGVALLVLAVALLANGATMWRREGRSLGNALSLLAGMGLLLLPVMVGVAVQVGGFVGFVVVLEVVILCGYVGVVFLVFLATSLAYAAIRPPRAPTAVIVLGSGLIRGEVPPLLRGRLDRGLAAVRAAPESAGTLLVPSGGQGPDEPRAEGDAMADYLRSCGVPDERLRPETRSRNTRENLLFSRALLSDDEARQVLVVTSDYHVLRAALLARRILPGARVVGSRTAVYFVPSAFLREFIAVLRAQWGWHVVFAVTSSLALVAGFAAVAYL